MKKLLAILLAVIMTFSLGICAFAADGEVVDDPKQGEKATAVPAFPTQVDGQVFIAAESVYVTPGQTVEIPVYIVSKVDTSALPADAVLAIGFGAEATGGNSAAGQITNIAVSDNIKAMEGYDEIECSCNAYVEDGDNSSYVAFAVKGTALLQSEKTQIATITFQVADTFEMGEFYLRVKLAEYPFFFPLKEEYTYEDGYAAVFAPDLSSVLMGFEFGAENFYFVHSYMQEAPDEPAWYEPIVDFLKNITLKIIGGLITVLQLLQGLLQNA